MSDERKRYALERRPSGLAVTEEGQIGVSDRAVFYPADHQLALAFVHFLNGDLGEAERLRSEWLGPALIRIVGVKRNVVTLHRA
jgi:hypothetical protein